MELKKSIDANIQTLRLPIILIGLLFISSITLVSFSYKAPNNDDGKIDRYGSLSEDRFMLEQQGFKISR